MSGLYHEQQKILRYALSGVATKVKICEIARAVFCYSLRCTTKDLESSLMSATTWSSVEEPFESYLQQLNKIFMEMKGLIGLVLDPSEALKMKKQEAPRVDKEAQTDIKSSETVFVPKEIGNLMLESFNLITNLENVTLEVAEAREAKNQDGQPERVTKCKINSHKETLSNPKLSLYIWVTLLLRMPKRGSPRTKTVNQTVTKCEANSHKKKDEQSQTLAVNLGSIALEDAEARESKNQDGQSETVTQSEANSHKEKDEQSQTLAVNLGNIALEDAEVRECENQDGQSKTVTKCETNSHTEKDEQSQTLAVNLGNIALEDAEARESKNHDGQSDAECETNTRKAKDEQTQTDEVDRGHMSKEARARKTIGIHGGEIELHGFRVTFPSKAVKKDIEFELTVDNNYTNYPTHKGVPIAPIFGVTPSMEFDEPVNVEVHTWYSAAKGKHLKAQLLSNESDEDWREDQEIDLYDQNQVSFQVRHFSRKIIVVSKEDMSKGLYFVRSEVYMNKKNGSIISAFYRDEKAQEDACRDFEKHDYQKVHPNYSVFSGKLGSVFKVVLHTIRPKEVNFIGGEGDVIKIGEGPVGNNLVQIDWYSDDFPGTYKGTLRLEHFIYEVKPGEPTEKLIEVDKRIVTVLWPIEESQLQPSGVVINVHDDKSRKAQYMADNRGIIKKNEQNAKSVQKIGK